MGTSAFEILIVPVVWATFSGYLAGVALHFVMGAVASLVGHTSHSHRSPGPACREARAPVRRSRRAIGRRAGSLT